MCITALFIFYRFAKNVVCTISALVVSVILGELKFFKNLTRIIILHVFIKNLFYPQNKYFL